MTQTTLSEAEIEQIIDAFRRQEIGAGIARERLGLDSISFGKLMQARGIPVFYTSQEDYDADARTLGHPRRNT